MPESILKQQEIAQYISDLYVQIRQLKREVRLASRTQELATSEEAQDVGGGLAFRVAEYFLPTVRVTSITGDSTFTGVRQQPAATGWEDDVDLTTELEVTVPDGISLPQADDIVGIRYTGNYGTGAATVARYGLFGAGGGSDRRAVIKSVAGDYLTCKELDEAGAETGDLLYVMKPWILRRSPFDGQTVNGVYYTYSSDTEREATPSGGDPETQQVTQDYFVGAIIVIGETNVEEDAGGNDTNIYDTNDSARKWAVPLEEE